ncbi:MAG: HAD family hydrolase [Promethearchaeota archaeon]|nr:MAG: HAD family hydrolase [Candidatus Lokiarchaeota archaeon]
MKKWLILDAMGVIFTVGRDLYELLIPFVWRIDPKIPDTLMLETYLEASKGSITSEELWNRLGLGNKYPEIEKQYLDQQLTIDSEFLALSSKFKKRYRMALLSNDVKEWSQYLRDKFKLNKIFDEVIISGEVGLRKPDKQIFTLLLEQLGTGPENCIFVDDNLTNLQAAAELGITTIRFLRTAKKVPFCSEFEVGSFKELQKVLAHFYE